MRTIASAKPSASCALWRLWSEDVWVARVLAVFVLSQLAVAWWDLPSTFGWECDGIAPRDLFGGLAYNLTPGRGHRYPLLHYVIVAVFSSPVLLWGAARADAWDAASLKEAMLTTEVMTGVSVAAKLIAIAMTALTVLTLARITRRIASPSAARWTALYAVTSLSLAYYGRVSNVDAPYLMWTVLALDRLLSIGERGARWDYVWFAVLASAAVATKAQAYASFVLVAPMYLVVLPLLRRGPTAPRKHFFELARAFGLGVLAYGLMSGGLFNPTGFVTRVRMLTGPNSQDWRMYPRTAEGVLQNLWDIATRQPDAWWPWPMTALCWVGVAMALVGASGSGLRSRVWRMLPLLAAVSFLATFTLVAARNEERFLLPAGVLLAVYGGIACDKIVAFASSKSTRSWTPRAAKAALGLIVFLGGIHAFRLHLTQWFDARYSVEHWLSGLPAGSVVETYGLIVYQPRYDTRHGSPYRVQRVAPSSTEGRNPLPGATELRGRYADVAGRKPDVIVVPDGFANRFRPCSGDARGFGSDARDEESRDFFCSAMADSLPGYRLAFVAEPAVPAWLRRLGLEPLELHGSVGSRQWILVRRATDEAPGRGVVNSLHLPAL